MILAKLKKHSPGEAGGVLMGEQDPSKSVKLD
jgi:hypothetical protein